MTAVFGYGASGRTATSAHDALAFVGPGYVGRAYHNIDHIIDVCRTIDVLMESECPESLGGVDQQFLLIAACFHDYVYAPGSPFNEEASAFVAGAWLETRGLSYLKGVVTKLIMTTKTHTPPDDDLMCQIISDADLWGLGYPEHWYAENSSLIRVEFAHVDDDAFNAGRREFLEKMLGRPYIYATKYGRRTREYQARLNMTRELNQLKRATL